MMKISMMTTIGLGFMVINTTFNNISVISWRSVLLVEETVVPGENHQNDSNEGQVINEFNLKQIQSLKCTLL